MSVLEAGCSLTLLHTRGYGTHRVVLSVCLSVCLLPTMATSNGHNSETTSSIATKRGIEMGRVAFSDVKSLSTKCEARKVAVIFTKRYGDNTVDLTPKVPASRK